ncbi:acyl-CoA carboxylase subunit beta, partial [Gammaproteobacteria bacterium]|nr:acyl-CoA carboxylase subunit beta [Gammaproteobacteria bacterium]
MEIKKIKQKIISKLDIRSEVYKDNYSEMIKKLSEIEDLLDLAEIGGGPHHHARLAKRGKMSIRDRIF